MTLFNGHTPNAGHFLQPTAMAMGQSVMIGLLLAQFAPRTAFRPGRCVPGGLARPTAIVSQIAREGGDISGSRPISAVRHPLAPRAPPDESVERGIDRDDDKAEGDLHA